MADNQAIYGVGRYGVAVYGSIPVTVPVSGVTNGATLVGSVSVYGDANLTPQSVQASVTADTDVIITADAVHTLVSVSAAFAQGSVGVVGVAIHQVDGVQATGQNNTAVISADANVPTTGTVGSVLVGTAIAKASATAQPIGVFATGVADVSGEGWRVYSQVIVEIVETVEGTATVNDVVVTADAVSPVFGSTAVGNVGTTVVVAKANTTPESAVGLGEIGDGYTFIEGVGEFAPVVGEEATGFVGTTVVTADNVYIPDSVFATVTADTDIIITADSVHTLISVVGTALNGGVGQVIAKAQTIPDSVEVTGYVNDDLFIVAEALVLPTAETATGVIGEPVVVADSNTSVTTERMRTTIGSVVVEADSVLSVAGLQAQAFLEDGYEVTASALQTVSGFALTLSKTDPDVTTEVTIFYPDAFALDRVAYVPTREGSNNRTAIVSATESRVAHVPADTQSRTIPIAA